MKLPESPAKPGTGQFYNLQSRSEVEPQSLEDFHPPNSSERGKLRYRLIVSRNSQNHGKGIGESNI